ncbi:hypothetical protein PISMIDRAFT_25430 [Pisolithus microcarpus 441]|uniref:Unplaced genomic scaffold scaffold_264, whole genome shotgun sequence n=1 Tax=Pisolithus microcarpus 441 TaxID=765257 RepID=A0A0C9Z2J4_9AGAM|nr:hypothetical protein PISMIDRAFT_25430 [Pisolithus microcarpus 441]
MSAYVVHKTLLDEHTDSVNALSFSPCGREGDPTRREGYTNFLPGLGAKHEAVGDWCWEQGSHYSGRMPSAWDVASMTALWHIRSPDIPKQIASSAVYLDLNAIVINTLHDGLYLFKLGSTKPVWRWFYECNCEAEVRYPLLVSFLHDGKAIMSGSPTGSVCIWQTKSKELYQVLPHSDDVIQAVSATQRGAWSYVAAASAGKGVETYIKIWRAKHYWSDYGRMSWTILYGVVCIALACGLVRLAWHNTPWAWIAVFLIDSIGKVIDLLQQIALFSYGCLCSLLLALWTSIADVWAAIVSHIRSTLRTFIGLLPVDGFQHPPYLQVPPQYDLPVLASDDNVGEKTAWSHYQNRDASCRNKPDTIIQVIFQYTVNQRNVVRARHWKPRKLLTVEWFIVGPNRTPSQSDTEMSEVRDCKGECQRVSTKEERNDKGMVVVRKRVENRQHLCQGSTSASLHKQTHCTLRDVVSFLPPA